jgi:hypothetical protein
MAYGKASSTPHPSHCDGHLLSMRTSSRILEYLIQLSMPRKSYWLHRGQATFEIHHLVSQAPQGPMVSRVTMVSNQLKYWVKTQDRMQMLERDRQKLESNRRKPKLCRTPRIHYEHLLFACSTTRSMVEIACSAGPRVSSNTKTTRCPCLKSCTDQFWSLTRPF